MGEVKAIDSLVNRLHKPEVRTPYTELLIGKAKEYFGEMFSQPNPPELIVGFKERKGILLFTGSISRGTARPGSSDFDVLLIYDNQGKEPLEDPAQHLVERITDLSEDYHPQKISFPVWLAQQLKINPILSDHYQARKDYLRRVHKKDISDEIVRNAFISMDSYSVDLDTLARTTEAGGPGPSPLIKKWAQASITDQEELARHVEIDTRNRFHDYLEEMGNIPGLLVSNEDFIVDSGSGNLLQHQRKIVGALAILERNDPQTFERVYRSLNASFRGSVLYRGGNHGVGSGYYDALLKDYVSRSGRFNEDQIGHATEVLKGVKYQVKLPPFEAFKSKFLS